VPALHIKAGAEGGLIATHAVLIVNKSESFASTIRRPWDSQICIVLTTAAGDQPSIIWGNKSVLFFLFGPTLPIPATTGTSPDQQLPAPHPTNELNAPRTGHIQPTQRKENTMPNSTHKRQAEKQTKGKQKSNRACGLSETRVGTPLKRQNGTCKNQATAKQSHINKALASASRRSPGSRQDA